MAEKCDLFRDRTAEVVEGFADVGWVVVGFIGVLRGDLEHLLVDLLEGIDTLLKLDVVGRELGLDGER